jgi:diguanylate cyclase (GGDEF)-like protein
MKTIIVVSRDAALTAQIDRMLSPLFRVAIFSQIVAAVDYIYNSTPNLIVVEILPGDDSLLDILNNLKEDPLFKPIPVLAVLDGRMPVEAWETLPIEDYLFCADLERDLLPRVRLSVARCERVVEINPLTRLPGNISINRQIEERMEKGESFAFAYADLDNFKPFNDKYGFGRGDEVIKIAARLILCSVMNWQARGSFVGHIGGDDFVFIMSETFMEEACKSIIQAFDRIIPTLYDPADRTRGGIDSVDRQGAVRFYPFIGISIGVTGTCFRRFAHFGALIEAASEMKNYVKKTAGSSYSMDKRADPPA